jgi:hypothetical protein
MRHILNTGQTRCYNSKGQETSCLGYGHDGEIQTGIPWPTVRFTAQKEVVVDHLTVGLGISLEKHFLSGR